MIIHRGLVRALSIVLALASVPILTATPVFAGPVEDAGAVIDKWVQAFTANDADAVVKLYTADAVLLGTSSPYVHEGTESIRTYFSRLPKSGDKVVISMRRMTVVDDNVVVGTGFYDFTLSQGGKVMVGPARFTMVLVKRDGVWLITNHHSSQRTRPPS